MRRQYALRIGWPGAASVAVMSNESILLLRGVVTLACLVGVPAVALVGVSGERPSAVREAATPTAKVPRQASERDRPSRGTHAVAKNPSVVNSAPNPPTATIRNVTAAEPLAASAAIAAAPDLMTRQLARLQELGATYYRLESAPHSAADFSFHCRVAGVERPFEAADPVATNAIAQVLSQIEALGERRESTAAAPASVYRR